MKYSVLFVFCVICFNVIANTNYITYHKQIVRAESCILDSNYVCAVNIYKATFLKYDYIFPQHVYTAVQTAIVANMYNCAFAFLEKGVKFGFSKTEIYKDSLLIKLTEKHYWNTFASKYDSLRNIYLKSIDYNLQSQVVKLYNNDLRHRNKCEEYPRNLFLLPINIIKWKKSTTSDLEQNIVPLIDEYGYLGQRIIGIVPDSLCAKYTVYKKFLSTVTNDRLRSVFTHYYSFRHKNYYIIPKQEVERGNILPRTFAMLNSYISHWVDKKYIDPYKQSVSANVIDTATINKNRLEIGLESLQELTKKRKRVKVIFDELNKGNYYHIRLWYY